MKVCVNKDVCIGCGLCVNMCSDVFFMDSEGKSDVKQNLTSIDESSVKDAAAACPVNAIKLGD